MQQYFDNAATSFPKPDEVVQAMAQYQEQCGASPGRGAYYQAKIATDILDQCRSLLCELVHAPDNSRCIFTLNCTDALNLAIMGLASHHRRLNEPVHIVTTAMDHNSVFRPLHALIRDGVTHTVVPADIETGIVSAAAIAKAITPHTRLVAIAHGSNVTGTVQNITSIGQACENIPLLVDAAQTIGHTHIDVQSMGIDLLAFPGHKGLLGPLGTGGLIMSKHMSEFIDPIRFGGTGSESEHPIQPTTLPDKFESGSHNMIGLCGLMTSVKWILSEGVRFLHDHEIMLCKHFIREMKQVPNVHIVGPQTSENRCGVFSLRFDEEPERIATRLEETSGISCRAGLHCAPFAHETMGTLQLGGTVRISFGPFHTIEDVSNLVHAINCCSQQILV